MSAQDEAIQQNAIRHAQRNKKRIARQLTDRDIYLPEESPVSVFMAGSPGAGKTEASVALLEKLEGTPIIRIDPDELRSEFEGYDGGNAWLFQGAVSIIVEKMIDLAFRHSQSFLLDGTLCRYDKARSNVERSLKHDRAVQILYVYQEPMLAWAFVEAREAREGRRIRPEHFIEQFFAARDVVNRLKTEFGRAIRVDLLIKNIDNSDRFYKNGVDKIDNHVPEKHSRDDLIKLIGLPRSTP